MDVAGQVLQFFRLQRRPKRWHLVAAHGEHREDSVDSQCGRDRLAATLATLTMVSMTVDTRGLVKAFAVREVSCSVCSWRDCRCPDCVGLLRCNLVQSSFEAEQPDA